MSRHLNESNFEDWELFFSRTQRNGVIASGNKVFARVSKYELKNMLGKAHSLVRHPDMPRSVFKYMWDQILSGEAITSYVKNKASDGSYYWVLATVFVYENEFVSVRIKPKSTRTLEIVEPLYRKIKASESNLNLEAQVDFLCEEIKALGYENYSHFMQVSMKEELDLILEAIQNRSKSEDPLHIAISYLEEGMSNLVKILNKTSSIVHKLQGEFEELKKLSHSQELLPFNLTLSTQKSKTSQKTMEVLSGLFAQQKKDVWSFLQNFRDVILEAEVNGVAPLRYDISGCFVLTAMVSQFFEETSDHPSYEIFEESQKLLQITSKYIESTMRGVNELRSRFIKILSEKDEMGTLVKSVLSIAQLGQVEISQDEGIQASALPHINEMRKMAEHLNEKISNIGFELKQASDNLNQVSRTLMAQNKRCVQVMLQLQRANRMNKAA